MHDELDGEAHGHDEVDDRDGIHPHAVPTLGRLWFRREGGREGGEFVGDDETDLDWLKCERADRQTGRQADTARTPRFQRARTPTTPSTTPRTLATTQAAVGQSPPVSSAVQRKTAASATSTLVSATPW